MAGIEIYIQGASCRLWLENAPQFKTYKTACLGELKAPDLQTGKILVEKAIGDLKESGFEYVIGPMNGNTWNSYRVALDMQNKAAFFLEPQNPDFYPAIFEQSSFDIIGHYSSGLVDLATVTNEIIVPEGIHIRTFRKNEAEAELKKIYQLSLHAFANNFLYTRLDEREFMSLYEPVLPYMNADFVLMAEDDSKQLQGLLFAIPDFFQGKNPDRIIVKTYASRIKGVGRAMLDNIHTRAKQAGFQYAIHALMHDNNVSSQRSAQYGSLFRRYHLYGRKILL